MINFKLLAPECLLKWLIISLASSPLNPPINFNWQKDQILDRYNTFPNMSPRFHSFATPLLQSLSSTSQMSPLACWNPSNGIMHPTLSQIQTPSHVQGAPHNLHLSGSDLTICCALLLTSLQPSWPSFCFVNTANTFSCQSPCVCSSVLESSAPMSLLMVFLYCSKLSLHATSLETFPDQPT